MKKVVLLLFVFLSFVSVGQIETIGFLESGVDQVPENYGGKEELKRFLEYQMKYPKKALSKKIEGNVDIKYTCSAQGVIQKYEVIASPDKELEAEAIRLFKMLLFKPAVKETETVAYEHYISIPFSISKYKKSLRNRSKAKHNPQKLVEDTSVVIYVKPDKQASYIYGNDSLRGYVYSELEYPGEAKIKGIEGTVALSFIVEPNGFISNLNVEKSIGGGCTAEAVRVLTDTKWKPAEKDKKLVRSRMTYSVTFKLNNTFRDNSQGTQRPGGY